MITLVVPGSIAQPTGGYRYDAALLNAMKTGGRPCRLLEIDRLEFPEELVSLRQEALPKPHWLVVDGLALTHLQHWHAELLASFSSRADRTDRALVALVHHPLCDETGLDSRESSRLKALEHDALRAVDLIITTSRHTELRIRELFDPQAAILVVEPGLTAGQYSGIARAQVPGIKLRLLCLASLLPRKGQDILVRALSSLGRGALDLHGIECVLAGDTSRDPAFANAVVESIQRAGLAEYVSVTGPLDDAQVAQALQDADVLVLPSLYEGYGMVIDEAMAAGLPVITTDGGALKTTFRPGTGIQIESGNQEALANAIVRLAVDVDFRLACGETARQQPVRSWAEAAAELRLGLDLMVMPARRTDLFDADWLRLREPVDHTARDNAATVALQDWMASVPNHDADLVVVDLGAGLGSNLNFLTPMLEEAAVSRQVTSRYFAIDHDPIMLDVLRQRPETVTIDADLQHSDVLASTIEKCFESTADTAQAGSIRLVTGSALLDLVNPEWIGVLLRTAAKHRAALLFALSVNGQWTVDPCDAFDDTINRLFNDHQQSGGGCGADAAACFESLAGEFGFSVVGATSHWQLAADASAEQRELLSKLLAGWEAAIREQLLAEHRAGVAAGQRLLQAERWFEDRRGQIKTALLSIELGHNDIFAIPAISNSRQPDQQPS